LPFTLTMVAKGSCWVQVRQGDGGPVVFEATLQPGETKTVDGTGNLFLRLGNPNNVALTIGGREVSMSVASGTPYNFVFQAS
jgi:RodZ C-terminal domain